MMVQRDKDGSIQRRIKLLGPLLLVCSALCAQDYPEMITVQGGSFTMGEESGDPDEKPAHQVTVKTFSLAKTETTVGQWRIFCQNTGRRMPEAPWFGQESEH